MKQHLLPPLLLSSLCLCAACGGGSGSTPPSTAQTAPAISVVPQEKYNSGGAVNTERVNAVQSAYQQQGARQVGTGQ